MKIIIELGEEGQVKLYSPFGLSEDIVVQILQHCIKIIEEKEKDVEH